MLFYCFGCTNTLLTLVSFEWKPNTTTLYQLSLLVDGWPLGPFSYPTCTMDLHMVS